MENDSSLGLLHVAVAEKNVAAIDFLLEHRVNVDARVSVKKFGIFDCRFVVANSNNESILKITQPALMPHMEKTVTALHIAVMKHKTSEIAEILLSNGANINATVESGETPLILAIIGKNLEMVKFLLSKGAACNIRTHYGKTALHYAAQIGHKQISQALLDHHANVNAADRQGVTPLHEAVEAGNVDTVDIFIKAEADLSAKTRSGAMPLHFAAVMRHRAIMEKLLEAGCDVNKLIKNGQVDLEAFDWMTEDEQNRTSEFVSRYTHKMNLFNWYNTVLFKPFSK